MKKQILNVLYQSDDNYAMVSSISIVSLLENNKHLESINIYYCAYEISKESRAKIKQIAAQYKNAHLSFIETAGYHKTFTELGVRKWHGVYITWLKLLAFGDLKLDTDRVVFINGHTIINGALDELINVDMGNNVMALAYDCLLNDHKATIGLKPTDGYFNCGIMLINHKVWQKESLSEYVKEHLAEKSDYVIADQDLCNVLFRDRIQLLDATYNFSSAYYAYDLKGLLRINDLKPEYFYTYRELMETYYAPKIIHSLFGIKGKPWEQGSEHPQAYLWQKYIRMTPWRDAPQKPATKSLNWKLYDLLPGWLFLSLYRVAVKRKFG